jgi:hypothetical protein
MAIESRKPDKFQKTDAFLKLGLYMQQFGEKAFRENPLMKDINHRFAHITENLIENVHITNPWFTPDFVRYSIFSHSNALRKEYLEKWLSKYPQINYAPEKRKKVGVIMAGNVPLVGFHDFLCVLLSGHKFSGRLSSKDDKLLPSLADILLFIEPGFQGRVEFTEEQLKGVDAVIATGSDNSSRYFDHYFGKYPNIIRKNRNGTAIITGEEKPEELRRLADDIFLYFGLGCRNVSKVFLPAGYHLPAFLDCMGEYAHLIHHNKYANNYEYHKALYLLNQEHHFDTGFLLVKEDPGYASPIGCLYYEYYDNQETMISRIKTDKDKIQCVATKLTSLKNKVKPGSTQKPMLWNYADDVDTLKFLINLSVK